MRTKYYNFNQILHLLILFEISVKLLVILFIIKLYARNKIFKQKWFQKRWKILKLSFHFILLISFYFHLLMFRSSFFEGTSTRGSRLSMLTWAPVSFCTVLLKFYVNHRSCYNIRPSAAKNNKQNLVSRILFCFIGLLEKSYKN